MNYQACDKEFHALCKSFGMYPQDLRGDDPLYDYDRAIITRWLRDQGFGKHAIAPVMKKTQTQVRGYLKLFQALVEGGLPHRPGYYWRHYGKAA